MRILVVARKPAYLPNFRPVLRALAERGHELRLAFELEDERVSGQMAMVDELIREFPTVSRCAAPVRADRHRRTTDVLRRGLDALRYLDERYAASPQLRARARRLAPTPARRVVDAPLVRRPRGRSVVRGAFERLERALPVPEEFDDFLERERPDVLVVTPIVSFGGTQTDFLRAARRRGIPTAAWIYSWDNLTSKGSIHELPDRMMVWNDAQRREAVDLHGVPEERIVVTGAQAWDQWFVWEASTTRQEFAARVGLRADRPFVLYLGSSGGGLPLEAPFVTRWIEAMRASGVERLETAGVLIRPHPWADHEQWEELATRTDGSVSVFPRGGRQPNDEDSRADYYDSIHHSAAVAGANTSAFIESAIVGRPVLTVPAPEFRLAQTGTPHFAHFLSEGGGLLRLASSLEEHLLELESALTGDERWEETRRRFLTAFVRPRGLEEPATPRFVAAVEELGGHSVRPPRAKPAGVVARIALEAVEAGLKLDKRTRGVRRRVRRAMRRILSRARVEKRVRRALRRGRVAAGGLVRPGPATVLEVTRLNGASAGPGDAVSYDRPAVVRGDRGHALVCHCRQVSRDTVAAAIESGRATSLPDIQRQTTACTRCFGCRFDLERMLREALGDAYAPTPFLTRPEGLESSGRKTLPRRMYMPVFDGYRGHDVSTRVVIFNWGDEADNASNPVRARADLLAMDGTRLDVWETTIEPRCSAVLDGRELFPDSLREAGIGVIKLVVDAHELGSLRPYFHLMTPTSISTTHEKTGPHNLDRGVSPRRYNFLFPIARADREEEVYLFATNTEVETMEGQELVWRSQEGDEERVPVPRLELDQSACVALHEAFPAIASGTGEGTVRLEPPLHKVAGFMLRIEPQRKLWKIQHL